VETIFRRLEAWGYPVAAIDWLRKRRLLVIVVLAVLSWLFGIALFLGVFLAVTHLMAYVAAA